VGGSNVWGREDKEDALTKKINNKIVAYKRVAEQTQPELSLCIQILEIGQ
jgi:hypothetical protein